MKRRVLGFGSCCYHVTSRINEDRFYLAEGQKAVFLDLLKRSAVFSGVEVLSYSIMDNHFHLLVHVPVSTEISDRELLRRLKKLYSAREYDGLLSEYERCRESVDSALLRAFRKRYLRRMYDLSEFMSTLKQRFSIWFNKKRGRQGPLWNGRFRSVLVQSSVDERGGKALMLIAAYIDLNAVRAGLVVHPKDYQWCGVADALRGDRMAIRGLEYVFGRLPRSRRVMRSVLKVYGRILTAIIDSEESRCARSLWSARDAAVLEMISQGQMLCFSRGWLFGDKAFVEFVAHRRPECFRVRRRDLATPVDDDASTGWYTAFAANCFL